MRLDKLISECGLASRTETARACRAGSVMVNGVPARKPDTQVNPEADRVFFCGREVLWRRYVYLLLNKPQGYVSATEDGDAPRDRAGSRGIPENGRLSLRQAG